MRRLGSFNNDYFHRTLRYYTTFKLRKFESLFYKYIFAKKTTTSIELQTEQILAVNIYTYFFQFWAWLLRFLFNVIFKGPASGGKKNEIIFAALYFYLQKVAIEN